MDESLLRDVATDICELFRVSNTYLERTMWVFACLDEIENTAGFATCYTFYQSTITLNYR